MTNNSHFHCRLIAPHETDIFMHAVRACYIDDVGLTDPKEIREELAYRNDLLAMDNYHHFVLFNGNEPIGISATWRNQDGNLGYGNLRIVKAHQKQGLSKLLYNVPLQHAHQTYPDAKLITLKVAFDNADSIEAAKKRGFASVGQIEDERLTYHRSLELELT